MKKIFLFALVIGALALTGCGGDDSNNDKPDPVRPDDYDNLRDSVGVATRPTDWQAVEISQLDITAPDRIVVTSKEIPVEVNTSNDLMGAFVDGECRAVTSPVMEENGQVHFTLVVMPRIEETAADISIELRYFSTKNKRIYIAEPFAFSAGTMQHGSLTGGGYPAKWK